MLKYTAMARQGHSQKKKKVWFRVKDCRLEHSNSRFELIRFDSLCESIRIYSFCKKKSAFRFTSCHVVFLLIYCIVSARVVAVSSYQS